MFVNVSMCCQHLPETLSSLRFAAKAWLGGRWCVESPWESLQPMGLHSDTSHGSGWPTVFVKDTCRPRDSKGPYSTFHASESERECCSLLVYNLNGYYTGGHAFPFSIWTPAWTPDASSSCRSLGQAREQHGLVSGVWCIVLFCGDVAAMPATCGLTGREGWIWLDQLGSYC